MGDQNGNARAEYEAATQNLSFSKDFNPALEAVIGDQLATAGQRVYAWIRRRAWGNWRLYCAKTDGTPAYQCDCAEDTGLDKTTVSHTVKYLADRGYLRLEGKLIYPILSPALREPPAKVADSTNFSQFFENWKVANSANFQELEVARSTIKRIRKVVLSDYKQWRTSQTNGGPSLYEIGDSEDKREAAAASVVDIRVEPEPLSETPPPTFPDLSPEHKNGNTLSATKDPQPQPARKPEPKPKPKPATKAEPEPEPELAPEPVKPVKVEPFVEAVQSKFPQNPPTLHQCAEVLAKLRKQNLPLDGFINYLNPERMSKIDHGGALKALVEGYAVTEANKAKAPPGCPYCQCDRMRGANCAACNRTREQAARDAVAREARKARGG